MVAALLRVILVIVLVVGVGAFLIGYNWDWDGDGDTAQPAVDRPVGTTGIEVDDARETGAQVGERVAVGVNQAQRATANAALTAKIKSKMALDDVVDAAEIDVDSREGVVTLTGRVNTDAERMQALELARETEGVVNVVDDLVVTHR